MNTMATIKRFLLVRVDLLFINLVFLCAVACTKNDGQVSVTRIRKNVAALTSQEKADIVDAFKKLKATASPYDSKYNYYDQFVRWHYLAFYCTPAMTHTDYPAHMNPAFLPWHRSYLDLLERAMKEVSGKEIALPYWDWTDAASTQALFADDFMGGNGDPADGYALKTGPFQKGQWVLKITDDEDINDVFSDVDLKPNPVPFLTRNIGKKLDQNVFLPVKEEIINTLAISIYDSYPWDSSVDTAKSFRNSLEGWRGTAGDTCINNNMDVIDIPGKRRSTLHNIVHVYVGGLYRLNGVVHGGNMAQNTSPNDPIFWIHHANIDRMWSSWMKRHGQKYLPISGGPMGANLNDVMEPFSVRKDAFNKPSAVLSEEKMGYRYDVLY